MTSEPAAGWGTFAYFATRDCGKPSTHSFTFAQPVVAPSGATVSGGDALPSTLGCWIIQDFKSADSRTPTMKLRLGTSLLLALLTVSGVMFAQGMKEDVDKGAKDAAEATKKATVKTAHATKKAAQKTKDATTDAAEKTGDVTKEAAIKTEDATKSAAKKTGHVVKKGAKKTAHATKEGAEKTKDAVK